MHHLTPFGCGREAALRPPLSPLRSQRCVALRNRLHSQFMASRVSHSVKLKPADPFDLIRWLARSQSDPRKAVAELVQNSIDAHARMVRIERRRVRHTPALIIRDDGEGVLPELGREEALSALVTGRH